MPDVKAGLRKAVKEFWQTRESQHLRQGTRTGRKDAGARGAVPGGKHADGFARLRLGYLFMLQETDQSLPGTKRVALDHYPMDEEFQTLRYAKRYELVCPRLVREQLYDAACFIISSAESGQKGQYLEPSPELGIEKFCISRHARATAFAQLRK